MCPETSVISASNRESFQAQDDHVLRRVTLGTHALDLRGRGQDRLGIWT